MFFAFYAAMMHGKNDVEMITINVDTPLNAQRKVTAHMKAGHYDGPIGIKSLNCATTMATKWMHP